MHNKVRGQVVHNNKLTDPFEIRTGVLQGCLLSPLLFLVQIDWIIREALENEKNGIQQTLTEQLEDPYFGDDVCLISATYSQMQRKTEQLKVVASKLGMNVNVLKTKLLKVTGKVNSPKTLGGEDVETVLEFCYPGSVIGTDGGADKDISVRIGKVMALQSVWFSKWLSLNTKLRIFTTNVQLRPFTASFKFLTSVVGTSCESAGQRE